MNQSNQAGGAGKNAGDGLTRKAINREPMTAQGCGPRGPADTTPAVGWRDQHGDDSVEVPGCVRQTRPGGD